jgi:hypothetical protein
MLLYVKVAKVEAILEKIIKKVIVSLQALK